MRQLGESERERERGGRGLEGERVRRKGGWVRGHRSGGRVGDGGL